MRKTSFITLFLLIQSIVFGADISKVYETKSVPKICSKGTYDQITMQGYSLMGKLGTPALPYQTVSLLLPEGEEAKNITFKGLNKVELPGTYNLYPMQASKPLSDRSPSVFMKDETIYSSANTFPAVPYGKLITEYMKGHAIAFSTFTPFEYNPKEGKLFYYQNVEITIETTANKNIREVRSVRYAPTLKNLIDNPEMINRYTTEANRLSDNPDILIITDEQFVNSFDEYKINYLNKGYNSQTISVQSIENEFEGRDTQEKIRNCIIEHYELGSLEYVVLAGDVEFVPYRGFFCEVQSSSVYASNDIPADIYYSSLDGTWNDDDDDKWGEPDEDDLLPDVSVARMTFSTEEELQAMLHKSLSYQNNPVLGELTHPLLAGEFLTNDPITYGSDYLELHVGLCEENNYTTEGIPDDYNISRLYEVEEGWNSQNLMDEVNSGRPLLYHVGHASPGSVMLLGTPQVTNQNFFAANGVDHNYTIVYTHGCDCGSFDNDDCIAEHMVKIDNFAVAFIGNSRYGWFNEGQTEGPSQHIHREFSDAVFGKGNTTIASAHAESKAETAPWVTAPGQWEEGAQRWCFYDCNVLADPLLPVWTQEPFAVTADYTQAVPIGTTELAVTLNGDGQLEGLRVSAIQDGKLIGRSSADENGEALLLFDEGLQTLGDVSLVVSGSNILPTNYHFVVIPVDAPYVIYYNHEAEALSAYEGIYGNGESILLSVEMKNYGAALAENVDVTVQSESPYVTFTDATENYGSLEGGETSMIEKAFALDILDGVPDQTVLDFIFNAQTDNNDWESQVSVNVNAPKLEILRNITIDDAQGNNNGCLDPGEAATIRIELLNSGHRPTAELHAALQSFYDDVSISVSNFTFNSLNQGESVFCEFPVQVAETAQYKDIVTFMFHCEAGAYQEELGFSLNVGLTMEDFESGDFTAYDWNLIGNNNWTSCQDVVYEGEYSVVSGSIEDSQSSELQITVDVIESDTISFARKVSSESNYDFLTFYIDDLQVDEWSGEKDWEVVKYPITAGVHSFRWVYAKDGSADDGMDCAWIDNIVFPPLAFSVNVENTIADDSSVLIYPNPSNGIVNVQVQNFIANGRVQVFNTSGQLLMNNKLRSSLGFIDFSGYESGIFLIRVIQGNKVYDKKVIIR